MDFDFTGNDGCDGISGVAVVIDVLRAFSFAVAGSGAIPRSSSATRACTLTTSISAWTSTGSTSHSGRGTRRDSSRSGRTRRQSLGHVRSRSEAEHALRDGATLFG
jgi:hypothetical protein